MESKKKKGPLITDWKVIWHESCRDDLSEINTGLVSNLVKNVDQKLSKAPLHIGTPLKGTSRLIYKVGYTQKYRILYTVNNSTKEVWILAVKNRDVVYKSQHFKQAVKLANVLHAMLKKHS